MLLLHQKIFTHNM